MREQNRLVLFCGGGSAPLLRILDELLSAMARHQDGFQVSCVVAPMSTQEHSTYEWCLANKIAYVGHVDGALKHPAFVRELKARYPAELALSLYFTERLPDSLLSEFDYLLNFHNGDLPSYRGFQVSRWVIANGEAKAAWVFHRIDSVIDTGNIVLRGEIDVLPSDTPESLDRRLADDAITHLAQLLDCLQQRLAGEPQQGKAHYYSRKQARAAKVLAQPDKLSSIELTNYLRAFAPLLLHHEGQALSVSGLANHRDDKVAIIRCSDGVEIPLGVKPL